MDTSSTTEHFTIRPATVADINVLAHHRCEMFEEMGRLRAEHAQDLALAAQQYFTEAIPAGEYVGWLIALADEPARIVAGGGMQLRRILPAPDSHGSLRKPGPQALILNVYTEPAWRRRGLGALLIGTMIHWGRDHGVASLVLHASPMGRALYERLGFLANNEMYYPL
jgi:GNAT superfamily N-acetyltransferase